MDMIVSRVKECLALRGCDIRYSYVCLSYITTDPKC